MVETVHVSVINQNLGLLEETFSKLNPVQQTSSDIVELLKATAANSGKKQPQINCIKKNTLILAKVDLKSTPVRDQAKNRQRTNLIEPKTIDDEETRKRPRNQKQQLLNQLRSDFSPSFLQLKRVDSLPTSRFGREQKSINYPDRIYGRRRNGISADRYNPHLKMTPPPALPRMYESPIDKLLSKNKSLAAKLRYRSAEWPKVTVGEPIITYGQLTVREQIPTELFDRIKSSSMNSMADESVVSSDDEVQNNSPITAIDTNLQNMTDLTASTNNNITPIPTATKKRNNPKNIKPKIDGVQELSENESDLPSQTDDMTLRQPLVAVESSCDLLTRLNEDTEDPVDVSQSVIEVQPDEISIECAPPNIEVYPIDKITTERSIACAPSIEANPIEHTFNGETDQCASSIEFYPSELLTTESENNVPVIYDRPMVITTIDETFSLPEKETILDDAAAALTLDENDIEKQLPFSKVMKAASAVIVPALQEAMDMPDESVLFENGSGDVSYDGCMADSSINTYRTNHLKTIENSSINASTNVTNIENSDSITSKDGCQNTGKSMSISNRRRSSVINYSYYESIKIGEVVWARFGKYPFWPSMIFPNAKKRFNIAGKL